MVVVGGVLVAAAIAVGCSTPGAGSAAGASRGERFFQTKCNACHPNGGQGAGPPIDVGLAPDFLERGKTSGRHAVPEVDWEPLLGYLNQRFGAGAAVATGGGAAIAAPTIAPAAVAAPTGDAAAGAAYFQTKCAKCHPGGSKIAGRAIPGVLVAGGTGKHGVPADVFNNLMVHLAMLGAVPTGAAQPAQAVTMPMPPSQPQPTPSLAVAPSAGDAAAGGALFQVKCAKCHPGGAKIAGRAIPGVLVAGGSGKHGVEAAQFENMLSFLVTLGAVRAGAGPVAAAPQGGMSMPPPPPPAPAASDGRIPMNAGMVPCTCACQCPPNAPPEAMPAACICQCACQPR
jgi:cytochrome c2